MSNRDRSLRFAATVTSMKLAQPIMPTVNRLRSQFLEVLRLGEKVRPARLKIQYDIDALPACCIHPGLEQFDAHLR